MTLDLIGYLAAILMGTILGITGAGGSILTVPILVYLFDQTPVTATAYSLFVVGTAAGFGAISYYRRGLLNLKTGLIFGIPAFVGVYLARRYFVPGIPDTILETPHLLLTKGNLIMLLFSIVMIFSAYFMIKGRAEENFSGRPHYLWVGIQGFLIGAFTGALGVAGGFMVVPALVILIGLEIKTAVGTTLFIVMTKSLLGFIGDIQANLAIEWGFLLGFTTLAVVGIQIGNRLSHRVPAPILRPAFGYFIILMGIFIFSHHFIELL